MLCDLTTLRLGGPAPELIRAATPQQVAESVGRRDVLVLGGGSNLVVADAGVEVPVVQIAIGGIARERAADGAELVTIGAGLNWDDVVAELTVEGLAEVAPLSGIPGSVGATPVQNVGAYGAELADFLDSVTAFDRHRGEIRLIRADELQLGYRSSMLRGTDRAVILEVTLRLHQGSTAVRYPELARRLGVQAGDQAPPAAVREAVLALRRSKGMVLDPADPDTNSAGSFFTNPILDEQQFAAATAAIAARLGPDVAVPAYPAGPGRTKLSAAWLIERAGFAKGYQGPGGRVSISTKHTLALTNRGTGSTADLLTLAGEIRDGVQAAFGVRLQPEPVLVGVSLG
ncbi:UDP-N-acetylmuramate dehydrogenase [Nakamurella lactea]|uniref:UDP-N-acetylmuramate dehydrogenase n=1 Tax=Nakamurella lactea TaxID=459515 RepID=UPI00040EE926